MILKCPACGTQYVVKDGAIPPGGRQVRCAACKHSWHQDPAPLDPAAEPVEPETEEAPPPYPPAEDGAVPASAEQVHARDDDRAEAAEWTEVPESAVPPDDEVHPAAEEVEAVEGVPIEHTEHVQDQPNGGWGLAGSETEEDFSPFGYEEEPERSRRWPTVLVGLLLIAAAAAAFWFLAPPEWKARLGIAAAGETPLQLMMTHSDRQKLASGNELLTVSGRVINPTDEQQNVPPIQAQLRSTSGQLVYSWTIAPPARTLPPRASRTFNSAEVSVPSGGDELTISLGSPKA